jgi:putative peptidoglycan lipid II flippase
MTGGAGQTAGRQGSSLPPWATAALLIAGVTVVARIIGFLRFVVLARTVGTECLGDVYATANSIPNIVYEVVVGGALVAVVVPLVAGVRERSREETRVTVAALHGWALLLLVPITALTYLASPLVIDVLLGDASGCGPDAASVATDMLWVFLLQIPIYGATVVAQGSLQAHHRFFAPAVAPAVSSLVVIGSYFAYDAMAADSRGSLSDLTTAEFWVLAGGTTLGVVALLAVQIPALVRARLVVMPSLRFPSGRSAKAWTLAWSGAVVVASQWIAYAAAIRWSNVYGDQGSALVFVLAWTLFLLPWSILALPIATSTFPRLSAHHERGERDQAARTTASTTRAVAAASAAGAGAMAAAATPLAIVLVQGAPGVDAVPRLAALLLSLSPGVLAYGIHGHLVRVLAAGHRAPVAAAGTAAGWAVAIVVAWWGVTSAQSGVAVARAIGIGFSVGLVTAAVILAVVVVSLDGRTAMDRVLRVTLTTGVAALVVGLVGDALWSTEDVGIGLALVQAVLAGVAALTAVGAAALAVDPGTARALWQRPPRRSKVAP